MKVRTDESPPPQAARRAIDQARVGQDLQRHVRHRRVAVGRRQLGDRHDEGAAPCRRAPRTPRRPRPSRPPRRGHTCAGTPPRPARTSARRAPAASTVAPAATSTKTGSGMNASFSRTRASPPRWTEPSMSADARHLAGRPEGERRRGAVAVGAGPRRGDGAPAVHQDAGGGGPERGCAATRAARRPAGSSPSADPSTSGDEVVERQLVDRRVAPDLLVLGGQRGRREGLEAGGPASAEPVGSAQARGRLGAEGGQGQTSFGVRECSMRMRPNAL